MEYADLQAALKTPFLPQIQKVSFSLFILCGFYTRFSPYIFHAVMKSSSIQSKSSTSTCSSCGHHKPQSPSALDEIPSLLVHESSSSNLNHTPSSSSTSSRMAASPSPQPEQENEYRAFLRQATKARQRRSLDVRAMMLSYEEPEQPHRMPRKLLDRGNGADHDAHAHGHGHKHPHMHTHTHYRASPDPHSRVRAPPRASSVQSDSGVDRLRESIRRKQTMVCVGGRRDNTSEGEERKKKEGKSSSRNDNRKSREPLH